MLLPSDRTSRAEGSGTDAPPAPPAPPALRCEGLAVGYGGRALMRGIGFEVAPGEIFAIIGGSGCGKSTLLRTLEGLLPPVEGRVEIGGRPFAEAGREPDEAARDSILRGTGALFQGGALFGSMTLRENVEMPLREFTDLPEEAIGEIARLRLAQVGLSRAADRLPSEISGGMAKRAGLARAMALDPRLLFLDEPSAGLDPVASAGLDELILRLRDADGTAVAIISHELPSLLRVADRCAYLSAAERRLLRIGPPRELAEDPDHREIREFFHRSPPGAEGDRT